MTTTENLMTTGEALDIIVETRDGLRRIEADRLRVEAGDDRARALLLLNAARIANDDDAVGNPHEILGTLASPTLTYRHRMVWFATLLEATATVDRYRAWRDRTAGCHHVASAALDECISTAADRAAIAVAVLLYGAPVEVAA